MERILLIEDDAGAQLLFRNRLLELGYEVIVAATGALGLMEARAGRFDLFLVDISLGSGIDGFEVCRRLKGIPQIHAVPVVLISGQVRSQDDLHQGYEAGCEAFLVKGDLTLVEDVVRAMLRIKSLQDDLGIQNRLLEEQNRHLQEERERGADLETALRESGGRAHVLREPAGALPEGILLVDGDGIVRMSDRGAQDLLGKDVEGKHLATVAPGSSLEAFVRNARTDRHEAFRFDLGERGKGTVRSLFASVIPTVPRNHAGEALRFVLLSDAGMRRVAAELLRLEERGFPRRELGPLLQAARQVFRPSALVGEGAATAELRARVAQAAQRDAPLLVRGESGTGKGLIARILHFAGHASGPFIPVDGSAIAPALLESELFGCTKGSVPEALADRPGLLQQAHLGTLFLEEPHELPLAIQTKLLRFLEDRQALRIGSTQPERVEVRIVASSDANLEELAAQGRFLPELLRRLEPIVVPALREREEDVLALAAHFLARFGLGRGQLFGPGVQELLLLHDWPGNVRELEHCIEGACALAGGAEVRVEHLPPQLQELEKRQRSDAIPALGPRAGAARSRRPALPSSAQAGRLVDGTPSLEAYEKQALLHALHFTEGDKLEAARVLKIGKSTFYRKLKAHGLS